MTSIVRKPWGREYLAFSNGCVAIWVLEIGRGEATSLHAHPGKNTAFIALRGEFEIELIRGMPLYLRALNKVNIFRGRFHRVRALTAGTVLLEVESPDDKRNIVRLEDQYGRAGAPIEEATEPTNESCLWLGGKATERPFAGCMLKTISPWHSNELCGLSVEEICVTLFGGLEHGLLPPGDAVDGKTLARIAQRFPMAPGSAFLWIKKIKEK